MLRVHNKPHIVLRATGQIRLWAPHDWPARWVHNAFDKADAWRCARNFDAMRKEAAKHDIPESERTGRGIWW